MRTPRFVRRWLARRGLYLVDDALLQQLVQAHVEPAVRHAAGHMVPRGVAYALREIGLETFEDDDVLLVTVPDGWRPPEEVRFPGGHAA